MANTCVLRRDRVEPPFDGRHTTVGRWSFNALILVLINTPTGTYFHTYICAYNYTSVRSATRVRAYVVRSCEGPYTKIYVVYNLVVLMHTEHVDGIRIAMIYSA